MVSLMSHRKDAFLNYRTNRYKLHFYETPTGMKFILNTDVNVANVKEYLHEVYKVSCGHLFI